MKKLLLILTLFVLAISVKAQFPRPAGIIQTSQPTFWRNPADSSITIYQGSVQLYNTFVQHFDTVKLSGWVNNRKLLSYRQIRDSVLKDGTASNYRLIHKIDSVMALISANYTLKNDSSKYYEKLVNKSTSVTTDGASDVKYPSAKAVKTYADLKEPLIPKSTGFLKWTGSAWVWDANTYSSGTGVDGYIPNFHGTNTLENSPLFTDGTNVILSSGYLEMRSASGIMLRPAADNYDYRMNVGGSGTSSYWYVSAGEDPTIPVIKTDRSGNFTTVGTINAGGDVTVTKGNPEVHLINTSGNDWKINSYSDGGFYIGQHNVVNAIVLSPATGNAVFSGTGYFNGSLTATNLAGTGDRLVYANSSGVLAPTATTISGGIFNYGGTKTFASAFDLVSREYVDATTTGLAPKLPCDLATTTGQNLDLSGVETIDGTATTSGTTRVLAKNQTTSAENGVYIAQAAGWTRSTDLDTWAELYKAYVVISGGSTNVGTSWICTIPSTGTINSDDVTWQQFGIANTITAGIGLTRSGDDIYANVDETSITIATDTLRLKPMTSSLFAGKITDETGSGYLVFATSPTLVTPLLGTPASGNLANCTALPAASITGILGATYGGTGINNGSNTLTISSNPGTINFSAASKTLTVPLDASVSGTNTGDDATNTQYSGLVTFPGFGVTTGKAWGYDSHPSTLANYGITDTPWTAYLPLAGGQMTGLAEIRSGVGIQFRPPGNNYDYRVNVGGDGTSSYWYVANGSNPTTPLISTDISGNFTAIGTLKVVGTTDDGSPDSIITVNAGVFRRSAASLFANASHNQAQSTITALPDSLLARYTKAQSNAIYVPKTLTITATAPLTIAGTTSADLSANRTIAISAATTSVPGSMSASDKTKLDGIAAGATNVTNTNQLTNGNGFLTALHTIGVLTGQVWGYDSHPSTLANYGITDTPWTAYLPLAGGQMTGLAEIRSGVGIQFRPPGNNYDYRVNVGGDGTSSIWYLANGASPTTPILSSDRFGNFTAASIINAASSDSYYLKGGGGTGLISSLIAVSDTSTMLGKYARKVSPTFTGTVVLPSTTSIGTITNTELSYVDGVTSAIQTQFTGKVALADSIGGAVGHYATGKALQTHAALTTTAHGGIVSSTLANTKILVGNGSNVATAVNISGDATITNTGAITVSNATGNMRVAGTLKVVGTTDDASPDSVITVNAGIFRRSAASIFTGSSAKWTTKRKIYGHYIDGSANMDSVILDTYISSATTWNAKQAALVNQTNIKSINGTTLLGSGDLSTTQTTVSGNAGSLAAQYIDWNSTSGGSSIANKPTIPAVPNLTVQALSGTTPTWNAANGINATITLSGNTTITLSNLVAGTSGNIEVINGSSAYTLTFAGYTNEIHPSIYSAANVVLTSGGSAKHDNYSWWYLGSSNGSRLKWNGGLNYK